MKSVCRVVVVGVVGEGRMKQLDSECVSSKEAEVLFYHNGAMSSERRLRYI